MNNMVNKNVDNTCTFKQNKKTNEAEYYLINHSIVIVVSILAMTQFTFHLFYLICLICLFLYI